MLPNVKSVCEISIEMVSHLLSRNCEFSYGTKAKQKIRCDYDRAFVCYSHHCDIAGFIYGTDYQGIHSR
jgi:hypothetical protein